jgi:hypothetical protein
MIGSSPASSDFPDTFNKLLVSFWFAQTRPLSPSRPVAPPHRATPSVAARPPRSRPSSEQLPAALPPYRSTRSFASNAPRTAAPHGLLHCVRVCSV